MQLSYGFSFLYICVWKLKQLIACLVFNILRKFLFDFYEFKNIQIICYIVDGSSSLHHGVEM